MRRQIQLEQSPKPHIPMIPLGLHILPVIHSHIPTLDRDVIRRRDPILRPDIPEPPTLRRDFGHRVVGVGDAIGRPVLRRRVGDVIGDLLPSDPGRAVGEQIGRCPRVAEIGSGQIGNGASQTVAHDDGAVVRVVSGSLLEGGEDPGAGFLPGEPEAVPGPAARAEVCKGEAGVEVGEPVLEGVGAAEGEDGEVTVGVQGDVARYVGPLGVLEFPDAGDGLLAGGFEEGAVVGVGAGDWGADVGVVGVVGAVRCGCILGEELEFGEGVVVDGLWGS